MESVVRFYNSVHRVKTIKPATGVRRKSEWEAHDGHMHMSLCEIDG